MLRLLAALAAALALLVAPAQAQQWPSRPIRLIAPYAAGGPVDISARLVAAQLPLALGQPVVVENRPGAGGNLGVEQAAKSAPDGYTLVMGAIATHAINPTLMGSVPYDPVRDFRHIALIVQVPNVLILNNDVPARNVAELTSLLKKNPGKLDFGSGSTGSPAACSSCSTTSRARCPTSAQERCARWRSPPGGARRSSRICRRSTNRASKAST